MKKIILGLLAALLVLFIGGSFIKDDLTKIGNLERLNAGDFEVQQILGVDSQGPEGGVSTGQGACSNNKACGEAPDECTEVCCWYKGQCRTETITFEGGGRPESGNTGTPGGDGRNPVSSGTCFYVPIRGGSCETCEEPEGGCPEGDWSDVDCECLLSERPTCGDGIVSAGEECELTVGNQTTDTCVDCKQYYPLCNTVTFQCEYGRIDEGDFGNKSCNENSECVPTTCNNGAIDYGEECDPSAPAPFSEGCNEGCFCLEGYISENLRCVAIVPECQTNADCSDGLFCNGEETCGADGVCKTGTNPCIGETDVLCFGNSNLTTVNEYKSETCVETGTTYECKMPSTNREIVDEIQICDASNLGCGTARCVSSDSEEDSCEISTRDAGIACGAPEAGAWGEAGVYSGTMIGECEPTSDHSCSTGGSKTITDFSFTCDGINDACPAAPDLTSAEQECIPDGAVETVDSCFDVPENQCVTYNCAGNGEAACDNSNIGIGEISRDGALCCDGAGSGSPIEDEVCDGIDNNCNGQADEGIDCSVPECGDGEVNGQEECDFDGEANGQTCADCVLSNPVESCACNMYNDIGENNEMTQEDLTIIEGCVDSTSGTFDFEGITYTCSDLDDCDLDGDGQSVLEDDDATTLAQIMNGETEIGNFDGIYESGGASCDDPSADCTYTVDKRIDSVELPGGMTVPFAVDPNINVIPGATINYVLDITYSSACEAGDQITITDVSGVGSETNTAVYTLDYPQDSFEYSLSPTGEGTDSCDEFTNTAGGDSVSIQYSQPPTICVRKVPVQIIRNGVTYWSENTRDVLASQGQGGSMSAYNTPKVYPGDEIVYEFVTWDAGEEGCGTVPDGLFDESGQRSDEMTSDANFYLTDQPNSQGGVPELTPTQSGTGLDTMNDVDEDQIAGFDLVIGAAAVENDDNFLDDNATFDGIDRENDELSESGDSAFIRSTVGTVDASPDGEHAGEICNDAAIFDKSCNESRHWACVPLGTENPPVDCDANTPGEQVIINGVCCDSANGVTCDIVCPAGETNIGGTCCVSADGLVCDPVCVDDGACNSACPVGADPDCENTCGDGEVDEGEECDFDGEANGQTCTDCVLSNPVESCACNVYDDTGANDEMTQEDLEIIQLCIDTGDATVSFESATYSCDVLETCDPDGDGTVLADDATPDATTLAEIMNGETDIPSGSSIVESGEAECGGGGGTCTAPNALINGVCCLDANADGICDTNCTQDTVCNLLCPNDPDCSSCGDGEVNNGEECDQGSENNGTQDVNGQTCSTSCELDDPVDSCSCNVVDLPGDGPNDMTQEDLAIIALCVDAQETNGTHVTSVDYTIDGVSDTYDCAIVLATCDPDGDGNALRNDADAEDDVDTLEEIMNGETEIPSDSSIQVGTFQDSCGHGSPCVGAEVEIGGTCCLDIDNNGVCDPICLAGEVLINGACCVDSDTNGTCDPVCDPNEVLLGGICCVDSDANGQCDPVCNSDQVLINGACCIDANNDGQCDLICPAGEVVINDVCCVDSNDDGICDENCAADNICNPLCPEDPDCDYICGDAPGSCTAQDDEASEDDYNTRAACEVSNECIGCGEDNVCNITCPEDPDCDYVCGDTPGSCTAQDDEASEDDYDTRAACEVSNECIGCGEDNVCNITCPEDPDCDYVCGDTPGSCTAQDDEASEDDYDTRAACETSKECIDCPEDGVCDLSCASDPDCIGDEDDHDVATIIVEICGADDTCNPLCVEDPDCDYGCGETPGTCSAQDDELSESDFDTRAECATSDECVGCGLDDVCNETCPEDPDCDYVCGDTPGSCNAQDDELSDDDYTTRALCESSQECLGCGADDVCNETCDEDPDCDYACGTTPGTCLAQDDELSNTDLDTRAACEVAEICNETCVEDNFCDETCPEDPDCDYVCGDDDTCTAQDKDLTDSDVDTRALCEALCTDCSLDGVCDPSCSNDPDCGNGSGGTSTGSGSTGGSSNGSGSNGGGNSSGGSGGRGTAPELTGGDLAVVDDIIQKKIEIIEQQQEVVPESIGRELPSPLLLPATGAQL